MVKLYKLSTENLCNLSIDAKSARVGRSRAAKKKEGGFLPPLLSPRDAKIFLSRDLNCVTVFSDISHNHILINSLGKTDDHRTLA